MRWRWWRGARLDEARLEDAQRALWKAEQDTPAVNALADRLAQHRRENHLGEAFRSALRLREGHQ